LTLKSQANVTAESLSHTDSRPEAKDFLIKQLQSELADAHKANSDLQRDLQEARQSITYLLARTVRKLAGELNRFIQRIFKLVLSLNVLRKESWIRVKLRSIEQRIRRYRKSNSVKQTEADIVQPTSPRAKQIFNDLQKVTKSQAA
jgi:hypothetical protein